MIKQRNKRSADSPQRSCEKCKFVAYTKSFVDVRRAYCTISQEPNSMIAPYDRAREFTCDSWLPDLEENWKTAHRR